MIEEAKQVDRTSPRYIKGMIASIVEAGEEMDIDPDDLWQDAPFIDSANTPYTNE